MCQSCTVENQFQETANEGSLNLLSTKSYNHVHCIYNMLVTMKYHDTSYNNWFHRLYQNEYDSSKYNNEFDTIFCLKKRCRICVDKMMETFVKSVDIKKSNIIYCLTINQLMQLKFAKIMEK